MTFAVFAVFFTTIAGASAALLGMIEGLADFSASSLNYLAGWLSDRSGKRKVFAFVGYAFSALAKMILLVTSSIAGLAAFRVIKRLGKSPGSPTRCVACDGGGARGIRGYSFGVHKALDKSEPSSARWWRTRCSPPSGRDRNRIVFCSGLHWCRQRSASWF